MIALVVSTVIGLAALPPETRARLLSLSWHRDADTLRATLVAHATTRWAELTETVEQPGARAAVSVARGSGSGRELHEVAADDAVRALFDRADGWMALIGDAGSGKTTAATALFGELLARTQDDPRNRVPFYVRLSWWRAGLSLDAWNPRAAALVVAGRFTEAEAASDRALRLSGDDGPSCATCAELLARMGRWAAARDYAERARALVPDGAAERALSDAVHAELGV